MSYAENRRQCEAAGYIKEDHGVEVCGLNRMLKCSGYSCPSKRYWNKGENQMGWHKQRALERAGLVDSFIEEIVEGEG